jgi:hypothetical protein
MQTTDNNNRMHCGDINGEDENDWKDVVDEVGTKELVPGWWFVRPMMEALIIVHFCQSSMNAKPYESGDVGRRGTN